MGMTLVCYHLIAIPWNTIQKQNENTWTGDTQTAFAGKVMLDSRRSESISTENAKWIT